MENSGRAPANEPVLLVVPHTSRGDVRVREVEFARRLADRFETICVAWRDASTIDAGTRIVRFVLRSLELLRSVLGVDPALPGGDSGLVWVSARLVTPTGIFRLFGRRGASSFCRWWNGRQLRSLAEELDVNVVLLANAFVDPGAFQRCNLHVDIVDWFDEDQASPADVQDATRWLLKVRSRAVRVYCVSEPLGRYLDERHRLSARVLPNGADLEALRGVRPETVDRTRTELRLEERYAIGYIGNHASYSGLGFLLETFQAVREVMPDAVLVVVGPVGTWRPGWDRYLNEDVRLTGPVDPREVDRYFAAIDLGVLAQRPSMGTHFAHQIKVVEYSACRKPVVATRLRTLHEQGWPNAVLVDGLETAAWVDAIVEARSVEWQESWDAFVDRYSWDRIVDDLASSLAQDR